MSHPVQSLTPSELLAGCAERPSSKAAASEEAKAYSSPYVEPLSAARTPLADVVNSLLNTFGGLTDADNALLTARAGDIAAHINSGGGLLGFSGCALTSPYGYLGGAVTCGVQRSG